MKIVVLDGYTLNPGDNPWDEVATLGELTVYDRTPAELIVERARGAEIVLTNKTPLSAATLEQLPGLRFIAELATGYDNIDVAAAGRHGIPVANVPEYSTPSVAQHTLALLLELCNRVGEHAAAVKEGEWCRSPDFSFWRAGLVELAGLRLGIVGLGRIGGQVGAIAHALGMEVLAYKRTRREAPAGLPVNWLGLPELFAAADVVTLHCPLTPENRGFVDQRLLGTMKRGAFLINTARGALVNEADLATALNEGVIAGAALDVVSREPIAPDNPLLGARNCLITPHLAWASLAARRRLMVTVAGNIRAFITGTPANVVNGMYLAKERG